MITCVRMSSQVYSSSLPTGRVAEDHEALLILVVQLEIPLCLMLLKNTASFNLLRTLSRSIRLAEILGSAVKYGTKYTNI